MLGEIKHSADDASIVQSLMLARGGINVGGSMLSGPIRDALEVIVEEKSQVAPGSLAYWSFSNATQPHTKSLIEDLDDVAVALQSDVNDLLCNEVLTPQGSEAEISLRIYVTTQAACGHPLPEEVKLPGGRFVSGQARTGGGNNVEQVYAIPYVLVSEGRVGEGKRNVVIQGEYQFAIGGSSFAKYALFTDIHTTAPSGGSPGTEVWFGKNTLFNGPVHTNNFFRFQHNSWFGDEITSAGCNSPQITSCLSNNFSKQGASFYGKGFVAKGSLNSPTNPSYSNTYGTHAPQLNGGVDWSSSYVSMPSSDVDIANAAKDQGLYNNANSGDIYSLTMWAANSSGVAVSSGAEYQYIEMCVTSSSCTTYRYDENMALQKYNGSTWSYHVTNDGITLNGSSDAHKFNGVIYTTQDVLRFRGPSRSPAGSTSASAAPAALASFAQVNVSANRHIRITQDLKYEDRPCTGSLYRNSSGVVVSPTCDNLAAANVLGIYSQIGEVLVGNGYGDTTLNAPNNIEINGVLMSSTDEVRVENHSSGSSRGTLNLLGGIIERYYGAFGTVNSSTGAAVTGYSRSFTYDERMAGGLAPPYFPTTQLPDVKSVAMLSFGQREQLY